MLLILKLESLILKDNEELTMTKKQKVYLVLNDLEEIINIKSNRNDAEKFINEHDNDDYEIEERKLEMIDNKKFEHLYVVNCEMFSGYDEVTSSLFVHEKDAREFYFHKTKEFKNDCDEYMNEYPYIEKENNVELENCFIINFSKFNLN